MMIARYLTDDQDRSELSAFFTTMFTVEDLTIFPKILQQTDLTIIDESLQHQNIPTLIKVVSHVLATHRPQNG